MCVLRNCVTLHVGITNFYFERGRGGGKEGGLCLGGKKEEEEEDLFIRITFQGLLEEVTKIAVEKMEKGSPSPQTPPP